jgi:hypothetical protein
MRTTRSFRLDSKNVKWLCFYSASIYRIAFPESPCCFERQPALIHPTSKALCILQCHGVRRQFIAGMGALGKARELAEVRGHACLVLSTEQTLLRDIMAQSVAGAKQCMLWLVSRREGWPNIHPALLGCSGAER